MTSYILLFLLVFSFLMSATDLLPKRNWLRRVCTVSKLHQFVVTFISASLLFLCFHLPSIHSMVIIGMTLFVLLNNGIALVKYLPFYPKRIKDGERVDLKLFALNVRQKNSDYDRANNAIRNAKADIIVLTETNGEWTRELSHLEESHPHSVKVPLENTYGMLLYSKYEIRKSEVRFLVNEEVPSIHALLAIDDVDLEVILIHPEPPIDFRRLKEKDLEILKVTRAADRTDRPTVLCGDLNDVGWSFASRRMCEQTALVDPRIGRGFFNTYNALIPLFRYPIDHFFVSDSLKLVKMEVLEKCGSDHFPVCISLELPRLE